MRVALIIATLTCVTVAPRLARAQDSRAELARRDLLSRAERARAAGDHAEALALGRQAAEIRATPSLRFMLAQEHRALGHLVDAFDQASACAREADADAAVRNRELLLENCRSLAAEVEPMLARLAVDVAPRSVDGLRVLVGESELPRVLLGVPMPTMPGPVVVRVEATGVAPLTRTLTLAAGHVETLSIELPRPAASDRVESSPPRAAELTVAPPVLPTAAAPSSVRRTVGWIALAAGAVGLGVGVGGAVYRDAGARTYNDVPVSGQSYCPGSTYGGSQPGDCQARLDQVGAGTVMEWAGFVGGGALAVAGAILLVTAPSMPGASPLSLRCGPGAVGAGVQCAGSF